MRIWKSVLLDRECSYKVTGNDVRLFATRLGPYSATSASCLWDGITYQYIRQSAHRSRNRAYTPNMLSYSISNDTPHATVERIQRQTAAVNYDRRCKAHDRSDQVCISGPGHSTNAHATIHQRNETDSRAQPSLSAFKQKRVQETLVHHRQTARERFKPSTGGDAQ